VVVGERRQLDGYRRRHRKCNGGTNTTVDGLVAPHGRGRWSSAGCSLLVDSITECLGDDPFAEMMPNKRNIISIAIMALTLQLHLP